jgi:ribosomal protein L37AE/L43A
MQAEVVMLHDALTVRRGAGGRAVFVCSECGNSNLKKEVKANEIVWVCSQCDLTLAAWKTDAERETELAKLERNTDYSAPLNVGKMYRIKVNGLYIYPNFGGGFVTNPAYLENPPQRMPDVPYSLHPNKGHANTYFRNKAFEIQQELNRLGHSVELEEA